MNFHSPGIPIPIPHSRGNWGMGMKIPQLVNIPHIPHSRGMGMVFCQISPFPVIPQINWNSFRDLREMKIFWGIPIPIPTNLGNRYGNSTFPGNENSVCQISLSFLNSFTLRIANIIIYPKFGFETSKWYSNFQSRKSKALII